MLNINEEKKFADLRDKCRELRVPPPPEIMIGLKVLKSKTLIFNDIQRGHSWTRNLYNMLFAASFYTGVTESTFGAGKMSGKQTDTTINAFQAFLGFGIYTPLGTLASETTGIILGTNDTAFEADQYAMQSIITSGNGAGQLAYSAMSSNTIAYTALTKTWTITQERLFNNNSGSLITVKEVGLIGSNQGYAKKYLIERSALSPTVPVDNGAQLTVTYEISQDFSAID
jgi:hypothetical protein